MNQQASPAGLADAREVFREGFTKHQRGDMAGAEDCYRRTLELAPNHFGALHLLGVIAAQTGRQQLALDLIGDAIRLNGTVPAMHSDLGLVLKSLRRNEEALAAFDRAVALAPDFSVAWFNRGIVLKTDGRLDEALASYDRALSLQPDSMDARINRGNTFAAMGRFDDAIAAHDQALILAPNHPGVLWSKGYLLLSLGQLGDGWALHEYRNRRIQPGATKGLSVQQWSGATDATGRTVFLHWEQGFGDTIFYSRYAPMIEALGARVVMSVQAPLMRLMRSVGSHIEILGPDAEPERFDFHCPLMSLPHAFGTTIETIPARTPYLAADPDAETAWRSRLPPRVRPRIGLAWSGNPDHDNDAQRSISLERLLPLFTQDFDWFCLQKDLRDTDAVVFGGITRMHDFGSDLTDFADTAAIIEQMDLIISVDTSIAHLAAALGKPTWVLLPYVPDFRWMLDREDSPWYPGARLYRQTSSRDWAPVIERVGLDLSRLR